MAGIRIVAETGSDLSPELAGKYGISLVPMHVTFGTVTKDDGSFDPREIFDYYRRTGKTPTTSGSNTEDFAQVFDRIHAEDPEAKILYLAYSAVTTVSYSSAMLASEGRDYVAAIDTKVVTVGQALVCVCVAEAILAHPEWSLHEAKEEAERIAARAHVGFVPRNLDFLRAGGRCSNAKALLGGMLHIVPLIDLLDGKLVATKNYRGRFSKVISRMMAEYTEQYHLAKARLFVALTPDFEPEMRAVIEDTAQALGYQEVVCLPTGGVITSHGGIGAFGIAGLSED